MGQFQGVIRPQTPMGSRTKSSPLPRSISSSSCSKASAKPCRWPMAASACASRANVMGAPISSRMACAKSSKRASVTVLMRSSKANRSCFEVIENVLKAWLAAATALSTSAAFPRATVATICSVAGLITGIVFVESGETQAPSM